MCFAYPFVEQLWKACPLRYILNTDLSERETFLIGSIVSHWGFIESEIYDQTLISFADDEELPRSMTTNAQFSTVLELWLKRVVAKKDKTRRSVLQTQYDRIKSNNEFRQAVVHSRWEWRPDEPDQIVAVRVHKNCIKRVVFSVEDLAEFASTLGEIRYLIRFPGGLEDRAEEMNKLGGHMSRLGWDLMTGRAKLSDLTKTDSIG